MLDLGFIDRGDAELAAAEPLVMRQRAPTEIVTAEYFTEEVRRRLVEEHGEAFLYQGGLSIRTTLSPALQAIADRALRDGLLAYDRRHGWRGPEVRLESTEGWPGQLADARPCRRHRRLAAGGGARGDAGRALRSASRTAAPAALPLAALAWARTVAGEDGLGPEVTAADQVVQPGDVVWVERRRARGRRRDGRRPTAPPRYALRQPPEVEGAVVALDPHTGRVLAMSGGFSFRRSVFNRATQALRQPGSALKPFVYLAGLESGLTPSSILLDAPIVIDQGPGLGKWKPVNYSRPLLRAEHAAARAREVAQPDDRAARPGDRHGPGRRDGASLRHRPRHGPQSGLGARRRRGRPA